MEDKPIYKERKPSDKIELTEIQKTVLSFHNYMNEENKLSEEMFLIAWEEFNFKGNVYDGFRDISAKEIYINND